MSKTALAVTQGGTGVSAPAQGKSTLPYQSLRDFVNGTLITTNIDYNVASGEPWLLHITGNTYGAAIPFDIKAQGYIYNSSIINYGAISNGASLSALTAMNVGGVLCFWIPRQSYWQGFTVQVNSSYEGSQVNRLVSITDVAQPAGATKLVSIGITQAWHANNLTNLNQLTNGPGYVTAAGAAAASPVQSVAGRSGAIILSQADVLGLTTGSDPAFNSVSASGAGGFKSTTYAVNQRNPIWRFGNADAFGISYFQGTSGKAGNLDTIGLHFGTATAAASPFAFNSNGNFDASGLVTAPTFATVGNASGKQLIVSGAANSSTASAANIAVSNGNLHIDGCRDTSGVYLGYYSGTGGVYFGNGAGGASAGVTAAGVFNGSGAGLTGYAPNLNVGFLGGVAATRTMQKRRTRINSTDGTSLNSSITQPEMGFSYGGSGEATGPFMAFGGLNTDIDYSAQLSINYGDGSILRFRSFNGDTTTWNPWRDVWHTGNVAFNTAAAASQAVMRDVSGDAFARYLNSTDEGISGTAAAVTSMMTKRGDNYLRATTAAPIKTFLAITGADVSALRGNLATDLGTATELRWKNYGASHTICDMSKGIAPDGSAHNNTNPENPWSATYPTLMGYNGSNTYGVRVDMARNAENVPWGGVAGKPTTLGGYGITDGVSASNTSLSGTTSVNRIIGANGTAALPTYSFASDGGTDTGIYWGGDGYINFSCNSQYAGQFGPGGNLSLAGSIYGGGAGLTGFGGSFTSGSTDNLNATCTSRGYTWTGINYFRGNKGNGSYLGSNNSYALEAYSDDLGSAAMSFHRGGAYAVNMGLDPDNVFRIGGWSAPANLFSMDMGGSLTMAGNITAGGNITAYSDERLKTNWRNLPADFLARWAGVKHGTYDRTDMEKTQVGVSAQSVQAILPDAVEQSGDYLSLNYGGAAAVATVALAQHALEQDAVIAAQGKQLAEQATQIAELTKLVAALTSKFS